jgi:hypothetical protein
MPRSTLIIALCLCAGLVATGGGSALAISGFSDGGVTARQAQYIAPSSSGSPPGSPTTTPTTTTTPSLTPQGGPGTGPQGSGPANSGRNAAANEVAPTAEQAARETEAVSQEGKLAFTGWAALPILGLGVALLFAGLVLHRRTRPHPVS